VVVHQLTACVALLSHEFLKADWPRFEWQRIVADDPNNTCGAQSTLLTADRHSPQRPANIAAFNADALTSMHRHGVLGPRQTRQTTIVK
jgi:hypothetical protein